MKKNKLVLTSAGLVLAMSSLAFAGNWGKDSNGWYYMNDDGTYATDGWHWIDGNNDGVAECYCFDAEGYLFTNTIIDDAKVDSNGAWVQDGVVQTKQVTNSAYVAGDAQLSQVTDNISGTYKNIYSINDTGTWEGNPRFTIILQKLDDQHVKYTFIYSDERFPEKKEYIFTKSENNTYTCQTNEICEGYISKFTLDPASGMLIYHGEEEGDRYYQKQSTSSTVAVSNTNADWKQAYINYINSESSDPSDEYTVKTRCWDYAFINDDKIPELMCV